MYYANKTAQPQVVAKIKHLRRSAPQPGTTHHPLGPMVYRVPAKNPLRARAIAALVFSGSVCLLAVAMWLEPARAGVGTHQQLGMPPCSLIMLAGYPCPTCGMTTAFAHTVRGNLWAAFSAQPAGLAVALATVLVASVSLGVLVSGKVWAINFYRVTPLWLTLTIVLIILGGWLYKLAAGLITGTLPVHGS